MGQLIGDGNLDSQEYRNLQAAASDRETQVRHYLVSGILVLNEASQDVIGRLIEGENGR